MGVWASSMAYGSTASLSISAMRERILHCRLAAVPLDDAAYDALVSCLPE